MKQIAIYGFGGLGREVATIIINQNTLGLAQWALMGYFDDGYPIGTENKIASVLGGIDELNKWERELSVIIAIADPGTREKIVSKITNPKVSFPNIIAHDVFMFLPDTVEMGQGNLITYGCRLSCDVKLGNFNILNGCVSLGHDVKIGSYNVMFPDTRISGEVTIGDHNFFGARSFALQGIKIGHKVRIAAGSFLFRSTKDNYLYTGNPAKRTEI